MNTVHIDWLPSIGTWMLWSSAAAFSAMATVYFVRVLFVITVGFFHTDKEE